MGESLIKTAGEPYQIKLTPDRKTVLANGEDLSYVLVEALDKEGNLCPLANNKIKLILKGNAEIAGVGNGNPQSFEPFQSDQVYLFYGKAMIIIRSKDSTGKVVLEASSDSLKKSIATIELK